MPDPAEPDPIDWSPEDVASVIFEPRPRGEWHVAFLVRPDAPHSSRIAAGTFDARDDAWDYLLRGLGARSGPPPSHTLDAELRTYRARLDELLGPGDRNQGKWCVIRGDRMTWPCDSFESALESKYLCYGLEPALIRVIERVETVHRI